MSACAQGMRQFIILVSEMLGRGVQHHQCWLCYRQGLNINDCAKLCLNLFIGGICTQYTRFLNNLCLFNGKYYQRGYKRKTENLL